MAWRRPSNAEERRCWPVVEVAGRPSKATHIHTHTNSYIHRDGLVVGAALGRFYCSAFKDELTRARLTFSYTYIHSHTHTHQLKPTMHSAEGKATQACEKASRQPAHQQLRTACHARPVASMRTKGGTSWRSRKRERVSAWRVGSAHICWLARATCSSLVCAP